MESSFRDAPPDLKIIETLRLSPEAPLRGEAHMGRLARTCRLLGIPFDPALAMERLMAARGQQDLRARLTVALDGQVELTTAPLGRSAALWRVRLARGVLAGDPWRGVKTTHRAIYDATRATMPSGLDEILFLNDRGEVAEGTITNVFLERDGVLLTPPVASGVLPGVLRAALLAEGRASEAVLRPRDLIRGRLYMGNSLRGLIPAQVVTEDGD